MGRSFKTKRVSCMPQGTLFVCSHFILAGKNRQEEKWKILKDNVNEKKPL